MRNDNSNRFRAIDSLVTYASLNGARLLTCYIGWHGGCREEWLFDIQNDPENGRAEVKGS